MKNKIKYENRMKKTQYSFHTDTNVKTHATQQTERRSTETTAFPLMR